MPIPYFRAFRTRGWIANFEAGRRVIQQEMQQKVLPRLIKASKERTQGWKGSPDFRVWTQIDREGIHGYCEPIGPLAPYWWRVSDGVPGHWITVKKNTTFRKFKGYRPALRLNKYHPSTTPSGGYGSNAYRMPPTGYRRKVWWPGIRPRRFGAHIAEQVQPMFQRDMENAVRRAVTAAQREGSK